MAKEWAIATEEEYRGFKIRYAVTALVSGGWVLYRSEILPLAESLPMMPAWLPREVGHFGLGSESLVRSTALAMARLTIDRLYLG